MSPAQTILQALHEFGVTPRRLCSDSREVQAGDVFVALPGSRVDGRNYIEQALSRGAVAVIEEGVTEKIVGAGATACCRISVPTLASVLGELAASVYGQPSQRLWLAGVTGTNGKTSVSQWIAQSLNILDTRCGVIGTLGNGFPGALVDSPNTTPDAIALQSTLADMLDKNAAACAMEVSSIGLELGRVVGCEFKVAVLTNLTRDHLDFHGDMDAYAAAKRLLFLMPGLQVAVLNLDDPFGRQLAIRLRGVVRTIGYTLDGPVDDVSCDEVLHATHLLFHSAGLGFDLKGQHFTAPVVGRFNVANLLAVIGVLRARGFEMSLIAGALTKIVPPPGRMESLGGTDGPLVVVDYAHTPDALEKALDVLHETADARGGNLVCVFGCGGARDAGKRPQMGSVAERLAGRVVVTSDNPRGDDPLAIIADIVGGMTRPPVVEVDRARAIKLAIDGAGYNDVILLAGKGHEPYQEIAGVRHPFSDMAVAKSALAGRATSACASVRS